MHILLADDQPKVRLALRVLLERRWGLMVVGEATNADDMLALINATRPDLLLLAWELPGLSQAESLPALRRLCPGLAIVALSVRPELHQAALDAGADAFIWKCEPPERLLEAIADVWPG
jgi:DNA-binding NarL/FixJ family response regulator